MINMMSKKEQRESAKARRLVLDNRVIKSVLIDMFARGLLYEFRVIMVYCSKEPEVNTLPLIQDLLNNGKRVVVPIIERDTRTLRMSYISSLSDLSTSTFNVPEPIGKEIPARPDAIEAAIIPMIAFDRDGNRIGYGAGYYDKFLASHPHIIKIGLAFACQEEPSIVCDATDIVMDYIVTERGVIWTRK